MAAVSGQRLVVGLGDVLLLTLVIDPSMMDTNDNRETLRVNTSRLALISSLTVTTRRPHGFQSCRGKSVGGLGGENDDVGNWEGGGVAKLIGTAMRGAWDAAGSDFPQKDGKIRGFVM